MRNTQPRDFCFYLSSQLAEFAERIHRTKRDPRNSLETKFSLSLLRIIASVDTSVRDKRRNSMYDGMDLYPKENLTKLGKELETISR